MKRFVFALLTLACCARGQFFQIPHRSATAPGGGGGGITQIQKQTCHVQPSTSITCTFASSTTAGNTIVVMVSDDYNVTDPNTRTPWTVTDAATGCASPCNTVTTDVLPFSNSGGQGTGAVYHIHITTGGTSHAVTLTATGGTTYLEMEIREYSGMNASAPFDISSNNGSATSGTWTSTSLTTAAPNEMIVGFVKQNVTGKTFTVNSPWTLVSTIDDGCCQENATIERLVTTATSYTATGSTTGTVSYLAVLAAFKP